MKLEKVEIVEVGMIRCKVCHKEFKLDVDEHYLARDNTKTGMSAFVSGAEVSLYDAIDCPHCGCQSILQERKRVYMPENIFAEYDEDEENEEVFENESESECECCDSDYECHSEDDNNSEQTDTYEEILKDEDNDFI